MASPQTVDGSEFKHDVRNLGQGVDALKADIGQLGRAGLDAAHSGAAELRQNAQHAVEVAREKAHENYEKAKESVTHAAHSMKDVITHNPIASIGIAAGVGLLLGLIVSRSRN